MKKIDYVEIKAVNKQEDKLDLARQVDKQDDATLPTFTKEVPISKKIKENSDTITIDYQWGATSEPNIKIRAIEFRKEDDLSDVYRLNVQDGKDTMVIRYKNSLYLLRKTTTAVAKALLTVYKRISSLVENVVGYFRTLFGNTYVISKVEKGSWTFDEQLADHEVGVKYITLDHLTEKQRANLLDIIVQKLSALHSKDLVLGSFSLKNILLTNTNSHFTDLRNLRLSRKPSLLVEEFKAAIRYLLSVGIADRDTIYPAVASYCVANESACKEWHKERLGEQAAGNDIYDVTNAIESEVVS